MKRTEVIKGIIEHLSDKDVAIFTTGMISREAFFVRDRKANFYMIGSMGLVSSVGLGIALNTDKRVIIFDGDGSILMDMGNMAMIAAERPPNLIHFVLDNESYQSTGGQPTISKVIDLASIAKAVGYKKVMKISHSSQLKELFPLLEEGPVFIHVKVEPECLGEVPRIPYSPEELTQRMMEVLSEW